MTSRSSSAGSADVGGIDGISPSTPLSTAPCVDTPAHGTLFVELFAGAGGLTAAILRLGLPANRAMDVVAGSVDVGYADLLDDLTFRKLIKLMKQGRIRWLHGDPPCKTFTRARRSDAHGAARQLRSERYPQGLPGLKNPRIREGNLLAQRFAKLATCVHRAGGWWSLEDPERSYV